MEDKYEEVLRKIKQSRETEFRAPRRIAERNRVVSLIKKIQVILYPGYYHFHDLTVDQAFEELVTELKHEIGSALCFSGTTPMKAEQITASFIEKLPDIMRSLDTDIQAIYDGDPAASSKAVILLCYPGFYAISIYRIAHELYRLGVPFIPRIMTEYAHEKTGIDINPGAVIGDYFCIDHGTGIVIGETAVLGHHVKLYQGVTIGAKSFEKDENGNPVKGGKRHPDIGNNVVIYANATILGGNTQIGDNAVIGGNVWIISSVEPGRKVYYTEK
ncbi:MAG: serine O-acetyltransferase [Solobacterium sp.]|nr:serine O-acetyltransferase [Solobacterium sp.]